MIDKKRTRSQGKNKIIFSTGTFLFLLGFLGMIYSLWINPSTSASDFLPTNTVIFAEFSTKKNDLKKLDEFDFTNLIDDILARNLPNISSEDMIPWVGEKISIAWLPNNEFILSAKYRDKRLARKFMEKFLVAGENFAKKKINDRTVYSPSFSSQISFIFQDRWLVISSSGEIMNSVLSPDKKLSQLQNFREINDDLPRKSIARSYFNLEELAILTKSGVSVKTPLIKALSKTVPAFGLTAQINEDDLSLNSKFLTTEGVFSAKLLEKTPNEVVPELAQYSPQDVLFFMNGYDLNAKYLHTKNFLEEFHPQFALIFDGVLRAEFKKIFGENFDFQVDLLNRIKNQYAIILNFMDSENPFAHFTLITSFGDGTVEKSSEDMKIIIKKAQQLYSTKIVEHSLPDGSSRQELVIADSEEINLKEKSENSYSYFTAETELNNDSAIPKQRFSYGFLNNFLVFSNHENGVKDVFRAYNSGINLTKNKDFRKSVLFDFSASESYGFVNTNKLASLIKFSRETSNEENKEIDFVSLIKNFRNISFARKTFPQEIFFSAILKKR